MVLTWRHHIRRLIHATADDETTASHSSHRAHAAVRHYHIPTCTTIVHPYKTNKKQLKTTRNKTKASRTLCPGHIIRNL